MYCRRGPEGMDKRLEVAAINSKNAVDFGRRDARIGNSRWPIPR